jgi:hypothetical protein
LSAGIAGPPQWSRKSEIARRLHSEYASFWSNIQIDTWLAWSCPCSYLAVVVCVRERS